MSSFSHLFRLKSEKLEFQRMFERLHTPVSSYVLLWICLCYLQHMQGDGISPWSSSRVAAFKTSGNGYNTCVFITNSHSITIRESVCCLMCAYLFLHWLHMRSEDYSTWSMCMSVCVCLSVCSS